MNLAGKYILLLKYFIGWYGKWRFLNLSGSLFKKSKYLLKQFVP